MANGKVKILTSDAYLRVLNEHKLLTFATIVDDHESHHQIDVLKYDTADAVNQRMQEVLIQVMEELSANDSQRRRQALPLDIQSMVDEAVRFIGVDSKTLH